jgi:hypothetical protein
MHFHVSLYITIHLPCCFTLHINHLALHYLTHSFIPHIHIRFLHQLYLIIYTTVHSHLSPYIPCSYSLLHMYPMTFSPLTLYTCLLYFRPFFFKIPSCRNLETQKFLYTCTARYTVFATEEKTRSTIQYINNCQLHVTELFSTL